MSALRTRAPHVKNCSVCDTREWMLIDGFANLPIFPSPNVSDWTAAQVSIPCVLLVCSNCGNVIILSLPALGLRDLQYEYGLMRPREPDA
jgi:hypothetical protein